MVDTDVGCYINGSSFQVVEVLGESYTRDVEFMELSAIEIDRCHTQTALRLTESTRKSELPGNLQYLRMCKSIGDNRILLIYGVDNDMSFRSDFDAAGIEIYGKHNVKVPKHSPCTVEQYKDWSQYWPLKYLKPKVTPFVITHDVKLKIATMMSAVLQESKLHDGKAVCIVTFKGHIIAKSVDQRDSNILNHAALLAVRKVATLQHRDPQLMYKAKRRYTGLQDNGDATGTLDQESDEAYPGTSMDEVDIPDYLCTDCEVFISHEPCCMCGMALLHSRVSSVTYYYPNARLGSLGSVYSLHNNKQLNHHFRVFSIKDI